MLSLTYLAMFYFATFSLFCLFLLPLMTNKVVCLFSDMSSVVVGPTKTNVVGLQESMQMSFYVQEQECY